MFTAAFNWFHLSDYSNFLNNKRWKFSAKKLYFDGAFYVEVADADTVKSQEYHLFLYLIVCVID